jgi:hypothetical protein
MLRSRKLENFDYNTIRMNTLIQIILKKNDLNLLPEYEMIANLSQISPNKTWIYVEHRIPQNNTFSILGRGV